MNGAPVVFLTTKKSKFADLSFQTTFGFLFERGRAVRMLTLVMCVSIRLQEISDADINNRGSANDKYNAKATLVRKAAASISKRADSVHNHDCGGGW